MFSFSLKIRNALCALLVLGYGALVVLWSGIPDGRFHVYFLDVGQGDATFIKTSQNHQVLIDGGPGSSLIEELGAIMPYFDRSIDLMVLSHPHADHVSGLVEVLKRYDVECVLMTGVGSHEAAYIEFLALLDETEVPVFFADEGTDFLLGDVAIDVIYPFENIIGKSYEYLNNSSVLMRVVYGEKSILFTGDLESDVENEIVDSGVFVESDILKAGHHGSKTSSTLEFLGYVNPETVVISSGLNNSYGHPHDEVLKNFELAGVEEIYRTDRDGTVEFVF